MRSDRPAAIRPSEPGPFYRPHQTPGPCWDVPLHGSGRGRILKTLADRYRLDYAVGAGAMGIVWRARDLQLERMVAIKEVKFPAGLADEERVAATERAVQAATTAAQL